MIYFGHMKACTDSSNLSGFKVTIRHILFTIEYSPHDRKTFINTIIVKKGKGNIVNDLYTMNLIEADFNFINKVLAKLTMECTERNKLLPIE